MRSNQLVIFSLDDKIYALNLSTVERIIHSVEVTPLPAAPEIIQGIINYHGTIIPVINTRRLFALPEREIDVSDKFVIASTSKRKIALVADAVPGILKHSQGELVLPEQITPGLSFIEGVIKHNDNLIMIFDLESFLDREVENELAGIIN